MPKPYIKWAEVNESQTDYQDWMKAKCIANSLMTGCDGIPIAQWNYTHIQEVGWHKTAKFGREENSEVFYKWCCSRKKTNVIYGYRFL